MDTVTERRDLPPPEHPPREALTASASIEHEDGRWQVYLTVVFSDGVVRRRIQSYSTEQRARVAARWFERSADRDGRGDRP